MCQIIGTYYTFLICTICSIFLTESFLFANSYSYLILWFNLLTSYFNLFSFSLSNLFLISNLEIYDFNLLTFYSSYPISCYFLSASLWSYCYSICANFYSMLFIISFTFWVYSPFSFELEVAWCLQTDF